VGRLGKKKARRHAALPRPACITPPAPQHRSTPSREAAAAAVYTPHHDRRRRLSTGRTIICRVDVRARRRLPRSCQDSADHRRAGRAASSASKGGRWTAPRWPSRSSRRTAGRVNASSGRRPTSSAAVHHRNLVSLVGYCIVSDERLLVYEFVPNKTLDSHLHGE
jgi:hypothetical protein